LAELAGRCEYGTNMPEPTVVELVEIRELPLDVRGSRSLVVRWSDGSTSEAVRFYADEVLFTEGDLVGRTQPEIRALFRRRDVEFLREG
jgi:hypothetical protein